MVERRKVSLSHVSRISAGKKERMERGDSTENDMIDFTVVQLALPEHRFVSPNLIIYKN